MIDGIHVRDVMHKDHSKGKIICSRDGIVEEYPPTYSINKAVKEFKKKHGDKSSQKKEEK